MLLRFTRALNHTYVAHDAEIICARVGPLRNTHTLGWVYKYRNHRRIMSDGDQNAVNQFARYKM